MAKPLQVDIRYAQGSGSEAVALRKGTKLTTLSGFRGAKPAEPDVPRTMDGTKAKGEDVQGPAAVETAAVSSVAAGGNQYEIVRRLGEGGMAAVYLARRMLGGLAGVQASTSYAIKMMNLGCAGDPEEQGKRIDLFVNEVNVVAGLDHPNIVKIHDVGITESGQPFCVMEYLKGRTLEEDLDVREVSAGNAGRLKWREAACIAREVASALECAHEAGVLHLDVKTSNVFLVERKGREPDVKLIDFGIARSRQGRGSNRLTEEPGIIIGTPHFMSTEQARGLLDLDHRADIYSLGVVLYNMLTGTLPFSGDNLNDILINVLTSDAKAIDRSSLGIPAELEAIVLRCMRKDRTERYSSARQLYEALSATLERCSSPAPAATILVEVDPTTNLARVVDRTGVVEPNERPQKVIVDQDLAGGDTDASAPAAAVVVAPTPPVREVQDIKDAAAHSKPTGDETRRDRPGHSTPRDQGTLMTTTLSVPVPPHDTLRTPILGGSRGKVIAGLAAVATTLVLGTGAGLVWHFNRTPQDAPGRSGLVQPADPRPRTAPIKATPITEPPVTSTPTPTTPISLASTPSPLPQTKILASDQLDAGTAKQIPGDADVSTPESEHGGRHTPRPEHDGAGTNHTTDGQHDPVMTPGGRPIMTPGGRPVKRDTVADNPYGQGQ